MIRLGCGILVARISFGLFSTELPISVAEVAVVDGLSTSSGMIEFNIALLFELIVWFPSSESFIFFGGGFSGEADENLFPYVFIAVIVCRQSIAWHGASARDCITACDSWLVECRSPLEYLI